MIIPILLVLTFVLAIASVIVFPALEKRKRNLEIRKRCEDKAAYYQAIRDRYNAWVKKVEATGYLVPLPVRQIPELLLNEDEELLAADANASQLKTVSSTVQHTTGGALTSTLPGSNLKFSTYDGTTTSTTVTDISPVDRGVLAITSKRIIFIGKYTSWTDDITTLVASSAEQDLIRIIPCGTTGTIGFVTPDAMIMDRMIKFINQS